MDQRERTIREIADHLARALLAAAEYADSRPPAAAPAPQQDVPVNRARGRLLTIEEVGEQIGVSPKTIYKWRTRRPIYGPPAFKVGKYLRWKQADVDAWIAAQERGDV